MASSAPVFYTQATLSSVRTTAEIFGPFTIPSRPLKPYPDSALLAPLAIPYPVGYTPSKGASDWAVRCEETKQRVLKAKSERARDYGGSFQQLQQHQQQQFGSTENKGNKTVVRSAGGELWNDPTLLEWDKNDYRIFCGDLGNEVNDDILKHAFAAYASFSKAKVVRDKKTGKSKGYGFVSFKDPADFVKALREVNGKYVGHRPIKLSKSSWEERNVDVGVVKRG